MGVLTRPAIAYIPQLETHRLIPAQYAEKPPLEQIADDSEQLRDMSDLKTMSDTPLLREDDSPSSRHIVRETFTHSRGGNNRFSSTDHGAWYAGFELETSQAEVAWHKWVELSETGQTKESHTYVNILADFEGQYHDIRKNADFQPCLHPDIYIESQALAAKLFKANSSGIIYPSVRHAGGTCLACFRPNLVRNVRAGQRYRFTWTGTPQPKIEPESS